MKINTFHKKHIMGQSNQRMNSRVIQNTSFDFTIFLKELPKVYKCTTKCFKFIDPWTKIRQPFQFYIIITIRAPNTLLDVFGRTWVLKLSAQNMVNWGDLATCSSDALTLCQQYPPVKSYDQILCLAGFPIVIIM